MAKIVDVPAAEASRAVNPETAPRPVVVELPEAPRLFGGVRERSRVRAGIKQKIAE